MSIRVLESVGRANEQVRPAPGTEQLTTSDLVQRALSGDHWAEEALYRRHASTLLGVCTRLLRHGQDAEDVVQDAFVDAFVQMERLREPSQFGGWLTGIAIHKAHRRLRRRKLLRALGLWDAGREQSLENCLAPGVSPEQYADIVCLDAALRELPDAQRIAWQLRHVEGFQLDEVARHSGCSLATIKRRITQADAHVRKYVDFAEVVRE